MTLLIASIDDSSALKADLNYNILLLTTIYVIIIKLIPTLFKVWKVNNFLFTLHLASEFGTVII